MFFNFTEQSCSKSKQYIYKYTQKFNSFSIKTIYKILTRLFSNDFDIRFVSTILNSKFTSNINFKDNLLASLKHDNRNLTTEHQNIIVSIFSKYFENYLKNVSHYDSTKVFLLNELLKVVFHNIDLSLYITIENLKDYYNKKNHNLLDFDDYSFMINFFKEYALMGDCVSSISENLFKDTE